MARKDPIELVAALNNLCGESNEAAKIAAEYFDGDELRKIRRSLARCMETVESDIFPLVRLRFPELDV